MQQGNSRVGLAIWILNWNNYSFFQLKSNRDGGVYMCVLDCFVFVFRFSQEEIISLSLIINSVPIWKWSFWLFQTDVKILFYIRCFSFMQQFCEFFCHEWQVHTVAHECWAPSTPCMLSHIGRIVSPAPRCDLHHCYLRTDAGQLDLHYVSWLSYTMQYADNFK